MPRSQQLRIASDLALPLEAVSRTFGILAQKGAGKSNAAVVMAEEMYDAGLHWVAIDPKGDWHGVRSSEDGKNPGLPIVIFGGAKADVPLEPTAGAMLAELVVNERLSCVIDVSEFTEGEKVRFLAGHMREEGFAGRLYRLKNGEQDPTHLFLEECHDYIPQRPFKEQTKLVHVFGKVVTMGRTRGLGVTLISQRGARVNKDVLTQVDSLIVLRTMGPPDRKAIAGWLEHHGQAKEILESLTHLKDGEAWVWSPEWLGVTTRTMFRQRRTFDSGATPVQGRAKQRPATRADVDLGAIERQMQETIERAKAEDPRELQKELAKAKRVLAIAQKAASQTVKEVPVLDRQQIDQLNDIIERANTIATDLQEVAQRLTQAIWSFTQMKMGPKAPRVITSDADVITAQPAARPAHRTERPTAPARSNGAGDALPVGEERILTVIAQYGHAGGVERNQLSVISGYKRSSRDTYVQRLKGKGLVDQHGDQLVATEAGVRALGADFEPLPTGHALQRYWLERLPQGEARVLERVVAAWPDAVDRAEIDAATGYRRTSRDTYLQRLGARKLVEFPARGAVCASDTLFGS